ncbi:hypothetical protein [Micromonospora sp. DT229]|uniref:hypothetical protein n=1 Tax=Micromonospora sp. DT229 TaxID=3393430 RepID=UPI003CEE80C7
MAAASCSSAKAPDGRSTPAPPRGPDQPPSLADLTAARTRQRKPALPETLEWVHDSHPELLTVARPAGLAVLEAPLLVLDPAALAEPPTITPH